MNWPMPPDFWPVCMAAGPTKAKSVHRCVLAGRTVPRSENYCSAGEIIVLTLAPPKLSSFFHSARWIPGLRLTIVWKKYKPKIHGPSKDSFPKSRVIQAHKERQFPIIWKRGGGFREVSCLGNNFLYGPQYVNGEVGLIWGGDIVAWKRKKIQWV